MSHIYANIKLRAICNQKSYNSYLKLGASIRTFNNFGTLTDASNTVCTQCSFHSPPQGFPALVGLGKAPIPGEAVLPVPKHRQHCQLSLVCVYPYGMADQ